MPRTAGVPGDGYKDGGVDVEYSFDVRERLSVDQMHGKVIHGAARKSSRGVGSFWVGGARG